MYCTLQQALVCWPLTMTLYFAMLKNDGSHSIRELLQRMTTRQDAQKCYLQKLLYHPLKNKRKRKKMKRAVDAQCAIGTHVHACIPPSLWREVIAPAAFLVRNVGLFQRATAKAVDLVARKFRCEVASIIAINITTSDEMMRENHDLKLTLAASARRLHASRRRGAWGRGMEGQLPGIAVDRRRQRNMKKKDFRSSCSPESRRPIHGRHLISGSQRVASFCRRNTN